MNLNLNEQELKAVLIVFERFLNENYGYFYVEKASEEFKNGPLKLYEKIIKNEKTNEEEVAKAYEKLVKAYLEKIQE